ncbi:hypothetical protein J2S98_004369 [Arthrobacter oryzae]|nr:hypothetical protein [Arthrobacter oryzae]
MHNGTDKEAPANGKDPRLALVLASVFGSSQDATMEEPGCRCRQPGLTSAGWRRGVLAGFPVARIIAW